ncbi:hypothetical protein FGO68_gene9527 [Halteria grandinella]|uniref:Uncharacterized protein n=1 Tax=Halteria grandinella TaxID=5974 RepID=A0A8J8NDX9_HALGN|nr:hypothetical protein FGO68_gene9527 [Halteria grandinella]
MDGLIEYVLDTIRQSEKLGDQFLEILTVKELIKWHSIIMSRSHNIPFRQDYLINYSSQHLASMPNRYYQTGSGIKFEGSNSINPHDGPHQSLQPN